MKARLCDLGKYSYEKININLKLLHFNQNILNINKN